MSVTTAIFIDYAAKKKCYCPDLSYGEICVGCGCCAERSKERDQRRFDYWVEKLEEQLNFSNWIDGARRLQKKNGKLNLRLFYRMIGIYTRKLNDWERKTP